MSIERGVCIDVDREGGMYYCKSIERGVCIIVHQSRGGLLSLSITKRVCYGAIIISHPTYVASVRPFEKIQQR